jgi:hypothetical protein
MGGSADESTGTILTDTGGVCVSDKKRFKGASSIVRRKFKSVYHEVSKWTARYSGDAMNNLLKTAALAFRFPPTTPLKIMFRSSRTRTSSGVRTKDGIPSG